MANYSTNEFRSGLKLMLDGDPCSILENEFVKRLTNSFSKIEQGSPSSMSFKPERNSLVE